MGTFGIVMLAVFIVAGILAGISSTANDDINKHM